MENFKNQNVSSTSITPTSANVPTSNTNRTSTTIGFAVNDKGQEPQVFT